MQMIITSLYKGIWLIYIISINLKEDLSSPTTSCDHFVIFYRKILFYFIFEFRDYIRLTMDIEKIINQRNSFFRTKDAVINNKEEKVLEHFFESPAMKILLDRDLIKPLGKCPKTLWIDPNDRLMGKVQLKPPTSNRILKAFQHQNILEIGAEFEERIQQESEKKIEEARIEMEDFEKFKNNEQFRKEKLNSNFFIDLSVEIE